MQSRKHPLAIALDLGVHGVRSEIEFTRPSYRTEHNFGLGEAGRIGKWRKHTPERRRAELNVAFQPVAKPDMQTMIPYDLARRDAPRHRRTAEWRHHVSGLIRAGGMPWLAKSHASISSS